MTASRAWTLSVEELRLFEKRHFRWSNRFEPTTGLSGFYGIPVDAWRPCERSLLAVVTSGEILGVHHVKVPVVDLARSREWYESPFGVGAFR